MKLQKIENKTIDETKQRTQNYMVGDQSKMDVKEKVLKDKKMEWQDFKKKWKKKKEMTT